MPRPRRLLYFADATNVHTRRWVKHFVGLGYDVAVCTFDGTFCEGVRVFNLANRLRLPLKLHYLSHTSAVNGLVAAIKPDIVHAHYASSYGLLGARARFHPFVLSVWGSDIFDFPRRSLLHASILRFNLSAADVVCSTSLAMARETKKYSSKPIVVTPFGIDTDVYCVHPPPIRSTFTIGTVKKLETAYGIDILIRGFAILRIEASRMAGVSHYCG